MNPMASPSLRPPRRSACMPRMDLPSAPPRDDSAAGERRVLAVESAVTAVALLLLCPVLFDLWGSTFTEIAARTEHGLAQVVVWPWELARRLGWLPGPGGLGLPPWVPAVAVVATAGLLTALAALLDPRPGVRPAALRRLLAVPFAIAVGAPALVVSLALVFAGVALDPPLMLALLLAGAAGGLLGRRRRRAPLRWERSLSGLPPACWGSDHLLRFFLLGGAMAGCWLLASFLALPFDEAPRRLLLALDQGRGATGPQVLPWVFALVVVLLLVLAPPTRRAFGLMTWEPWIAAIAGGLLSSLAIGLLRDPAAGQAAAPLGCSLGFLGTLAAGAGIPFLPRLSPHPLRAVGRLGLPICASVAVIVHVAVSGFLGCGGVALDPRIRRITRQPGATDLALSGDGIFAAFGADGHVVRLALDGSSSHVVEGSRLPLEDLAGGEVRPALLGAGPGGRVFLVAEVTRPGEPSGAALAELDAADAAVVQVAEAQDCVPSSWGWNANLSVGVVGCRNAGVVLLYEPALGRFIAREELRGLPEFTSLAIDPADGTMLALARRRSPFVVRLDLEQRRPVEWRFLGMSNLTLHLDDLGVLRVARFLGRQVLTLEASGLRPAGSRPAGFALGPMELAPTHERVIAASLLDGHLYAADTAGRNPTSRLHTGGAVRALALGQDARTMYAAGLCGLMAVDLDAWLGR